MQPIGSTSWVRAEPVLQSVRRSAHAQGGRRRVRRGDPAEREVAGRAERLLADSPAESRARTERVPESKNNCPGWCPKDVLLLHLHCPAVASNRDLEFCQMLAVFAATCSLCALCIVSVM